MLLMIDNYDSFTYNLVQYFGELGQDVRVFRNDAISLPEIARLKPAYLVISPGPCAPAQAGISLAAIREFAGKITRTQLREIAEKKMKDLNANDLDAASKIIEGSARAMGLQVVEG